MQCKVQFYQVVFKNHATNATNAKWNIILVFINYHQPTTCCMKHLQHVWKQYLSPGEQPWGAAPMMDDLGQGEVASLFRKISWMFGCISRHPVFPTASSLFCLWNDNSIEAHPVFPTDHGMRILSSVIKWKDNGLLFWSTPNIPHWSWDEDSLFC